jgi:hypothetical protein
VKRSIDFPVDPLWIKNPTNSPLATPGARQGAATRTKLCIVTIGLVLEDHFKKPTPFYEDSAGWTRANRWTVTLTRISMGTLDPITGGASMKAVQDAIAQWCGVPNERDPVWQWVEPIRQEKRARGYFGVRIEIEDLAPGEALPVTLKTIDPFIWKAKQRIKEAKNMQLKKVGRVSSYQPEAAARGASSAARGSAEQAFSRLTAKAAEPTIESLTSGQRDAMAGVIEHHYGKPTALDLRDAAEGAFRRRSEPNGQKLTSGAEVNRAGSAECHGPSKMSHRDPGEERAARDLAPCTTCGVRTGEPCEGNVRPGCSPRLVFGVHEARARAAKLRVPADDREHVRPARAPTNGVRKVAAQRPMPAWIRRPWEQRPCPALCALTHGPPVACPTCDGRGNVGMVLRPVPSIDGGATPSVVLTVPAEHRARFGPTVTLTRRRHESARTGVCWLYE